MCLLRKKGDPERAETFLQDALKSYVSEGWSLLVTHTRKQIAECQKLLGRTVEYLFKLLKGLTGRIQCRVSHMIIVSCSPVSVLFFGFLYEPPQLPADQRPAGW